MPVCPASGHPEGTVSAAQVPDTAGFSGICC